MREKTTKKIEKTDVISSQDKKKAIADAMSMIDKKYGKGTIMKLGENVDMNVEAVSTGSLTLDMALGIGGVPRGRIVEIYGPESSGKTTVALHVVAEVQKQGGEAAFIDAEHALDPVYARALGVDVDNLLVSQPDDGEQALDILDALVRSNGMDVIVVDSVAALTPRSEIEGDMGASSVGVQARLMSQALRKLSGIINQSRCVVIFINQLRQKIGVVYGNPETTTGGLALKFYASVRIDVRKGQQIKEKTNIIGNHIKCKVVKNKVAPPFKVAEFDIMYGKGISREGEIVDIGVNLGFIEKSGSWFSYEGNRIGQGKENVCKFLTENPEIREEIASRIMQNAEQVSESLSFNTKDSGDSEDADLDSFDFGEGEE
ncbi:MAG: recombinase RecA [Ruminococcaceae bacterium]|nr:recombinase RecA [Oscillospiraceae bacterium]